MKFFVVGLNHNNCPVEIRETLHFDAKKLSAALEASKSEPLLVSELVILSTCNRVEFYGFSESLHLAEEAIFKIVESTHSAKRESFLPYLYRQSGKDAMHHLFRVASGLDSLVVGENEILGQVREAFRTANELKSVHSLLYRMFEKALKVGKDVRTKTKINNGAVSIPSVAVELAEKIFGKLTGQKVMVLGTGEMSEITLKNLRQAGAEILYVVSRNEERGKILADEYEAAWLSMDDWEKSLSEVDILISSTSAPHPIVRYKKVKQVMSARRRRPLFLIDIAVPRDIEPQINSLDDVYLYNIDDLKGVSDSNLKLRRREVKAAETMIEAAVLDYQGWLERLKARPTIENFEKYLGDVLDKELSKCRFMDEAARKELKARILAKLMHSPQERIREASLNGGVLRYVEALHSLFDLDKNVDRESR